MKTLMDCVSGRFRLRTFSRTEYLVDIDQMLLTRYPYVVDAAPDIAFRMRRDQTPVRLLQIYECTVGRPAHFAVDLGKATGVITFRSTTVVESIEAEPEKAFDV